MSTEARRRPQAATYILPVGFLVVIIALWEVALVLEWVDPLILPPPSEIAVSFYELLFVEGIWIHVWATLWETVAGFVIAAASGIVLAVITAMSDVLRKMLYPYVISLQVTPRIAIAPVIIAWLGFGYSPKIVIAALIAFFPIFVNTLTGMLAVDEDAREMFRSLGATRRQLFATLMLPSALPLIFAGLKTAMTLALIGAIVGEFISAQNGLGLLIQRFSYQVNMDDAFAILVVLTILGLILYGLTELFDRFLVFWTHDSRLTAKTRGKNRRAERSADKRRTTKSTAVAPRQAPHGPSLPSATEGDRDDDSARP